jgi:[lysine-biosynthesis-protein LysW]--L-2-aminoadipate ligase
MARSGDHWLTNAAKGADTEAFELDDEALELVEMASDAVGGGLLGVDLMETDGDATDWNYTVHEVNHTVEFKALDAAVDVDVPAKVVDWLETKADASAAAGDVDAASDGSADGGGDGVEDEAVAEVSD